jgi:hypothetical protein
VSRVVLIAALLCALCLPAAAGAADPIEGRWLVDGTLVLVEPAAGGFRGVAQTQDPANACVTPGTEIWTAIGGATPNYTGTANVFSAPPCGPPVPSTADFFAFADSGSVCVAGQPTCATMVRAVACNNAADDDGDGLIDTADPDCQGPTDPSEASDPTLDVQDVRVNEGAGTASVPVTLSAPAGGTVTAQVAVQPGSATIYSDFYPPFGGPFGGPPGSSSVVVPAGQQSTALSISLLNDAFLEPDETFTVQLSSPSGARLGRSSATVTILNDDTNAPPRFEDNPPASRNPASRNPANRNTTTERGSRDDDGRESATENLPVCGVRPPVFPGKPKSGKDGRQRCPKARPRARRSRGGSAGVDRMNGRGGGDSLAGLGGNDTLRGRGGGDRLHGGRGNDTLWGGSGGDDLEGGDGDDRLYGGPGDDWLIETRYGDDRLYGGPGNDVIAGNHGPDRIQGGAGDDIISGGSGPDTVDCGPGYDTLYINLNSDRRRSRGCERIRHEEDIRQRSCSAGGTNASEQVRGDSGRDTCRGRGGNDVLEGAGGSDRLYGGAGDDELFGRKGNELMYGNAGNDTLEGGQGADRMYGGTGNDIVIGGYGRDRLYGGPGNDTLNPGFGDRGEFVDCGPGRDTVIAGPGDRTRNCEVKK